MRVYSPLYETVFAITSIYEDAVGGPILVCENKSEGFDRMLFRPLEVDSKDVILWKGKPVEFHAFGLGD